MIVIAGIPTEPPVRLAIESAVEAHIDHIVVSQRDAHRYAITVAIDSDGIRGHLEVDGRHVDLDDVDGVYWRLIDAQSLPENARGADKAARARSLAFHEAFTTWVETTSCRVANPISAMSSNASKPYQATLIEQTGLATPDTVITTVPEIVEKAHDRWGPTIYKSVSAVRSIVRELDDDHELSDVAHLATQFQRRVSGTDVRVHVVGDDVHATRITTEATDYRYAASEGIGATLQPTTLPPDVENACRALAGLLDLPFCGIDLRHLDDGGWICFEVNPSPGYSYYQQQTSQPISASLVRWLAAAP